MSEKTSSIEHPAEQYPYRIKGWDKFQHYRFRNPPWIKLHVSLLQSEDWVMLDDSSRALAIVLMLIASQHEGFLPQVVTNSDYLKRIGNFRKKPKLKPLIECGFLIETLADASVCKQMHTNAIQRQSTETEKKESILVDEPSTHAVNGSGKSARAVNLYTPEFEEFWRLFPKREGSNPKNPAARKFQAAIKRGVPYSIILEGASRLAAAVASGRFRDRQFLPQVVTWINQERWQDDGGGVGPRGGGVIV